VANEKGRMTTEKIPGDYFQPRWYAVYTRSRHEKSVADQLRYKQIETFLPLCEMMRRWKNGDHRVQLPLFPGYTFVHIALKDRLHVLNVPGVVRLVGFDGIPVPLADEDVESLRRALSSSVKVAPHPYLAMGRRVRVTAGPLTGLEGILVRKKGDFQVVLSLDLIQRSVLVHIDALSLESVPSAATHSRPGLHPNSKPRVYPGPAHLQRGFLSSTSLPTTARCED
jgi:transcription termination/antitermination protein NusG